MIDPTLIADLIRAGVDPDLVQRVVDAVTRRDAVTTFVTPAVTAEAMRARKYRQNIKQKQEAAKANDVAPVPIVERDASRDGVTERCDLTSLPFLLTEETTKKETKKKKEDRTVVVEGRGRGSRITEDWQPRDEDREFVRGLGLDPQALRDEFVDYWIAVPGSRGFKLNWYSTYKNRGREVAGRKGKYNGRDGRNNVIDAQDRLNAKLAEFSQTDMLGRVRGTEGPPDVRLLPSNRGSGS